MTSNHATARHPRILAAAILSALFASSGCASAGSTAASATAPGTAVSGGSAGSGDAASPDRSSVMPPVVRRPHSEADVHFMSGMIPHHAQAVLIAGWAESHGARDDVRILAARIVVGQRDEIALMQNWLRDRDEPVPAADATHLRMSMNGMEHDMLMPGMLNAGELAALDRSRGADFDRLFLTYMIRHHEGAITMVDQLFASQGAAQDEMVFRFASDVYADQTTEVDRMLTMLASVPDDGR